MNELGLGPVSAELEGQLRSRVHKRGLVVWLDAGGRYAGLVDRLRALRVQGTLPYVVQGFRGSFLELLLSLEPLTGGVERPPLVVYLPGFTPEGVEQSPFLELYRADAGGGFMPELAALVRDAAGGQVPAEAIAAFLGGGVSTLEGADAWLSGLLQPAGAGVDGLEGELRGLQPTVLLDDLLGEGGFLSKMGGSSSAWEAVWSQLAIWTGLPADWRAKVSPAGGISRSEVAFVVASWALAVEYVSDLRRPPVEPLLQGIPGLPQKVIENCRSLAVHLRAEHRDFYVFTADGAETWLAEEVKAARASELGSIDTFRFEEDEVLRAALSALGEESWSAAAAWSESRLSGAPSFWLAQDPARRSVWQLVQDAARLGLALSAAGAGLSARTLEEALSRYAEAGAVVDQAHRHLEQRRLVLLDPQLPEFEGLRLRLDALREVWRVWADNWARDFSRLCQQVGFLGAPDVQQRTLFEEVVRPLTQKGTTVLFVVDALRFEMGAELFSLMEEVPATTAQLRARYAELPTTTEVGMNVLAPVAGPGGRLSVSLSDKKLQGFSTGVFRVDSPSSRGRAMWDRVGGASCPWKSLSEVLAMELTQLRRSLATARLYVVHSQEIDAAGETGVGPAVFGTVLQSLRSAWRLLREAGVQQFVFTADHGFLLLDETVRTVQAHGRRIDPRRRHVLSTSGAVHTGEVQVPLSALGYEGAGAAEQFIVFPDSTAVFDVGRRVGDFVHGGNSLQERVIPVLTLVHRARVGGDTLQYTLTGTRERELAGMHHIKSVLEVAAQGGLAFGGAGTVELRLSVPEDGDVQVELCDVLGGARLLGTGSLEVTPGDAFEVFFKLSGPSNARVQVQISALGSASVPPLLLAERFQVQALRSAAPPPPPAPVPVPAVVPAAPAVSAPAATAPAEAAPVSEPTPPAAGEGWLQALPEEVRPFFAHLAAHGTLTEEEAARLLGSPRALRRFSTRFEEHAGKAPFSISIQTVGVQKCYVRGGQS